MGQPGNDYVDNVKDEGKIFLFVILSLGLPGPLGVLISITRPVLSRSDHVLDAHAA